MKCGTFELNNLLKDVYDIKKYKKMLFLLQMNILWVKEQIKF